MVKQKRAVLLIWIVLCIYGMSLPLTALAEESKALGIDFRINTSLDTDALAQPPSRFVKDLKKALERMDLTGHVILQNGQADITGDLNLNGLSAVQFRLTGWEERLSLVTSLFGKEPVIITPPNYIPFLLKLYYYFDIPVQYIGVCTDPYSYMHGIKPLMDQWMALTGGTESRSYSPEECIAMATAMAEGISGNSAFYYWRLGLLQHVGLDELLGDFFYALPDWAPEVVENGGLAIEVTEEGETWVLGGETVLRMKRGTHETTWQLTFPVWEGYQLTGQCSMLTTQSGLQLSLDVKLMEEDSLYASLTVIGKDLPDGTRMKGAGTVTASLGGEALGEARTVMVGLDWNQYTESGKTMLDGHVRLLDPATQAAIFTVSGQVAYGSTEESFPPRNTDNIVGIDLFCMNDMTIEEFYANAKWPMIKTAIPFLLELPAGVLNGIVDWMDKSGILVTLMDGVGVGLGQ